MYTAYMVGAFGGGALLGNDVADIQNDSIFDYHNIWNKVTGGDGVAGSYEDIRGTRFLVKNAQQTLYMTNQSDHHISMTLYDVVPRRDCGINILDCLNQGNRVLQDNQNTAGAVPILNYGPYQRLGVEPYGTPYFMSKFKIVNQRTIIMHPGQVHRHTLNFNVNKMFNSNLLDVDGIYLRGWSAGTMIKIHGFPVQGVQDEAVTTIGTAKLGIVMKKEITYAIPMFSVPKTSLIYNNLATGQPQGVFQAMNADGDVEVQDNA